MPIKMIAANSARELLIKVERIKTLMTNYATGQRVEGDEGEYVELRRELVAYPDLELPLIVMNRRTLKEFWGFIGAEFQHYRERREYLAKEFAPVLHMLETQVVRSTGSISGDLFEHQFPAGLPFGINKPSLAFIPRQGSQKAIFEDDDGVGVIRKDVYPNFTFEKFQASLKDTPVSRQGFAIPRWRQMCQTQAERQFFDTYISQYAVGYHEFPFLIPQAWIQWHSKPKRDLRAQSSSHADDLYRVDFVAFWKNKRFAILIDDIGHYARQVGTRWDANEEAYSNRLKEDRKLRKEGWHLFRVSNWEIRNESLLPEILADFQEFVGS